MRLKIKIKKKHINYFKENWGAPFIISFMVLLVVCAGLLASGNDGLANEIAIYAYYSLVIGVVLQLVSFIREERRRPKGHAGTPEQFGGHDGPG